MVYGRVTISRDHVLLNKCCLEVQPYLHTVQCGCNGKQWVYNLYKQSVVLFIRLSACSDHSLFFIILVHCSSLALSKVPDPWRIQ